MNKYSAISESRLSTCHKDLQLVFRTVLLFWDNSILCGKRGEADQNEAFRTGASTKKYPDSNHNTEPVSMALDARPCPAPENNGRLQYLRERYALFAGCVLGVAQMLFETGRTTHLIRWGGDWNQNRDTGDERLSDLQHFELIFKRR